MKIFTLTKTTMVFSDKIFPELMVDFDFQGKPSLATVVWGTDTKDILHWWTKTTKYQEHFS